MYTVRTNPLSTTYVGGKECYKAACLNCAVHHNPHLDPTIFMDATSAAAWRVNEQYFLQSTGLTRDQFCMAQS